MVETYIPESDPHPANRRMPQVLKRRIKAAMRRTGISDEHELIAAGLDMLDSRPHLTLENSSAQLVVGIESLETELRLQSILVLEVLETLHELASAHPSQIDAHARAILSAISPAGGVE